MNRSVLPVAALLTAAAGFAWVGCEGPRGRLPPPPQPPQLVVCETSLGKAPAERGSAFAVSPDSRHVGYVVETDSGEWVVVDGVAGPAFKSAGWDLDFTADSRHVAYSVQGGEKERVVTDGVAGKEYDEVYPGWGVFGPRSNRVAYFARRGSKWLAVVDGVESREYDGIGDYDEGVFKYRNLIASPDGERLAYAARRGEKQFVVVDGVEGPHYDGIDWVVFSPDSRCVAYVGCKGVTAWARGCPYGRHWTEYDKQCVVVDGVEGKTYDEVSCPEFSPDSQRVAYAACRADDGDHWMAVVDGAEGKRYDAVWSVAFSPNSRRVAYVAERDGRQLAVVDGKEGCPYDKVDGDRLCLDDPPHFVYGGRRYVTGKFLVDLPWCWPEVVTENSIVTFSGDSRRVAYAAKQGGRMLGVVDGVEGKPYDIVWWPRFSPDSKHAVYEAKRDGKWSVVVDGVEGKAYDRVAQGMPIFSYDSSRTAYLAWRGEMCAVVLDGREGREYVLASWPVFGPGGSHAVWTAWRGDPIKQFILADGVEVGPYDGFGSEYLDKRVVFDGPNALHSVVLRGGELLLVEVRIRVP